MGKFGQNRQIKYNIRGSSATCKLVKLVKLDNSNTIY